MVQTNSVDSKLILITLYRHVLFHLDDMYNEFSDSFIFKCKKRWVLSIGHVIPFYKIRHIVVQKKIFYETI